MNTVNTDMAAYYAKRAADYEKIYAKPERQHDLAMLQKRTRELLRGHRVLEIACGTGYWTAQFAQDAEFVLATDINPEVIAVAQTKDLSGAKVKFALADAFTLQLEDRFSACFAGFWWSHVKREQQTAFLEKLRSTLGAGTLLVMIDNTYVEGSNTPIARTDSEGNTYQIRSLQNGERYEVIKNFPTDSALRKKLNGLMKEIRIQRFEHFWILSGKLK